MIDPCRNLVDRNANGDTLGEADPTEGGVDIGEKAPRSGGPLAVVDTGGAALYMPREGLVIAHHATSDRCARMVVGELGILDIARDIIAVGVDQRHYRTAVGCQSGLPPCLERWC